MIDEETSTDLWSLGVKHDGAVLVRSLLESFAKVGHRATVSLKEAKKLSKEGLNVYLQRDRRERS